MNEQGIRGTVLRTIDACHFPPDIQDIIAAVLKEHPGTPIFAAVRAVGELIAGGVVLPIGGFERVRNRIED